MQVIPLSLENKRSVLKPLTVDMKEEGILRLFEKHFIDEIPATEKKFPKNVAECVTKKG